MRAAPSDGDMLPCGTAVNDLIEQVADRLPPADPGRQGGCLHCRATLAELTAALWAPVHSAGGRASEGTGRPAGPVLERVPALRLLDAAALWGCVRAFGHTLGPGGLLVCYGIAGVLAAPTVHPRWARGCRGIPDPVAGRFQRAARDCHPRRPCLTRLELPTADPARRRRLPQPAHPPPQGHAHRVAPAGNCRRRLGEAAAGSCTRQLHPPSMTTDGQ